MIYHFYIYIYPFLILIFNKKNWQLSLSQLPESLSWLYSSAFRVRSKSKEQVGHIKPNLLQGNAMQPYSPSLDSLFVNWCLFIL